MGWSGGSVLMDAVIQAERKYKISDISKRVLFYKECIEAFENHDWDTQDECLGIDVAFDMAVDELHPEWKED